MHCNYTIMLIGQKFSGCAEGGGGREIQMPIGAGILSNLLLAAFPGEVLVYKLQSVLWSLFLVSPGLALLPIQLKGFLASKGKKKKKKNTGRGSYKEPSKNMSFTIIRGTWSTPEPPTD